MTSPIDGKSSNSPNANSRSVKLQLNDDDNNEERVNKSISSSSKHINKEDDSEDDIWKRTANFLEYDADEHEIEDEMGFMDPSNPPIPGWNLKYLQWRTRRFVEHFIVRILTAILILVDMVVLLVDLFINSNQRDDPLEYCSLAFSTYFMIEVILRLFGLGPYFFFHAWHNVLDIILVVFTFILSVVTVTIENMGSNPASLLVILRLVRLVRITRILWERKQLQTGARQFISQNKRRYQRHGFDLDLTYVNNRIIATSFPSSGKLTLYRNDIKDVAKFLDTRHAGHYRVYNLCSERHYDESYFHRRVERFLIDDHNVPSLEEMVRFSKSSKDWLSESTQNVIVVHCKGGKGRTGTMICVVLIDSGLFKDAEHCLGYFGDRRTDTNVASTFQGVETPSQSRYVGYYERILQNDGTIPVAVPLVIKKIKVKGINTVGEGNGSEFTIAVQSKSQTIPFLANLATRKNCIVTNHRSEGLLEVELTNSSVIHGDTRVMFQSSSRKIPRGYEGCPFFFWFHTSFIDNYRLELKRHELDNPHKNKTWHVFHENFEVIVEFETDGIVKPY